MKTNSDYLYKTKTGNVLDLSNDKETYKAFIKMDRLESKMGKLFIKLNRIYFSGMLPTLPIEFVECLPETNQYVITGMYYPLEKKISLKYDLKFHKHSNLLQDILLHEMIHFYIDETYKDKNLHGENSHSTKEWKTEVKRISKLLKVEYKESKSYLETFPVRARPKNYYEDNVKLISKKKVSQ